MSAPQPPSSESPIPPRIRIGFPLGAWGLTLLGLKLITNAPLAMIVFFPVGLFVFFLRPDASLMLIPVGWGLYGLLTLFLLITPRWRTFLILFAVLIALLMLNFAGCSDVRYYGDGGVI